MPYMHGTLMQNEALCINYLIHNATRPADSREGFRLKAVEAGGIVVEDVVKDWG